MKNLRKSAEESDWEKKIDPLSERLTPLGIMEDNV